MQFFVHEIVYSRYWKKNSLLTRYNQQSRALSMQWHQSHDLQHVPRWFSVCMLYFSQAASKHDTLQQYKDLGVVIRLQKTCCAPPLPCSMYAYLGFLILIFVTQQKSYFSPFGVSIPPGKKRKKKDKQRAFVDWSYWIILMLSCFIALHFYIFRMSFCIHAEGSHKVSILYFPQYCLCILELLSVWNQFS